MKRPSSRIVGRIHFITVRDKREQPLCMFYRHHKVRTTTMREEVTCKRCWELLREGK